MLTISYLETGPKRAALASSLTEKATALGSKCSTTIEYQPTSWENRQEKIAVKSCCKTATLTLQSTQRIAEKYVNGGTWRGRHRHR